VVKLISAIANINGFIEGFDTELADFRAFGLGFWLQYP
jgi:hypothetical protein